MRSMHPCGSIRRFHPGLTLVELLAALIILSAASTAGIRILRHSTGAAADAQRMLAASAVYEHWRERQLKYPDASLPWSWADTQGTTWTVAASEHRPAGTLAAAPADAQQAIQPAPGVQMQWRTITVSRGGSAGDRQASPVTFEHLEPSVVTSPKGATP